MTFNNRHGFHYMQILQNATALPAYIYRETNNKVRTNRKRHALSKQYWRKKHRLTKNGPEQEKQIQFAQTKATRQDNPKQNINKQQSSQEFIPSPFPEKRAPVIINSQARRKPPITVNTSPGKQRPDKKAGPTAQTPLKPKRTIQEASPIAAKWLRTKQETTTATHSNNDTRSNRPEKIPPLTMKTTGLHKQQAKHQNRTGNQAVTPQQPKRHKKTTTRNITANAANSKKFIWKPGRGAVEKIDKYSGEIFHLVEGV